MAIERLVGGVQDLKQPTSNLRCYYYVGTYLFFSVLFVKWCFVACVFFPRERERET